MPLAAAWRRLGRVALSAALLAGHAPPAEARSTASRSQRSHSVATRISRIDALAPPEDPAGTSGGAAPLVVPGADLPPPFAVDVFIPAARNSDPQQTERGTPSNETTPELRLTWSQRLAAPLRLSAVLDASTDRFQQARGANADLLLGRLRAQYESGGDDQEWQPFLSYQPSFIFAPTFATRLDTWHDFALGLTRSIGFDRAWARVPASERTDADTTWSFGVNTAIQRRERDGGAASAALVLNPSVGWTISEQWSVNAEVDLTARWYDRAEGRKRRDRLATPILTVEFQPPEGWLPAPGSVPGRALGAPLVDLQLFLSRQASSDADARFHQWGIGPILRTGWRF